MEDRNKKETIQEKLNFFYDKLFVLDAEEPEDYEENLNELLELFKQKKIKPASYQLFKMSDFVSAFNLFKERKVMGKVTLEIKHEY